MCVCVCVCKTRTSYYRQPLGKSWWTKLEETYKTINRDPPKKTKQKHSQTTVYTVTFKISPPPPLPPHPHSHSQCQQPVELEIGGVTDFTYTRYGLQSSNGLVELSVPAIKLTSCCARTCWLKETRENNMQPGC